MSCGYCEELDGSHCGAIVTLQDRVDELERVIARLAGAFDPPEPEPDYGIVDPRYIPPTLSSYTPPWRRIGPNKLSRDG